MDTQHDLFAKAEADLRSVEAQIASLTKRRSELAEFIALGRKLYGQQSVTATMAKVNEAVERIRTSRENSLKASVLSLTHQAIQQHGPQTTAQLVAALEAQGVQITGKDKNTTVSVILSRSDEFVSDRRNGWSLAEKNPQDVAASAGSSTA